MKTGISLQEAFAELQRRQEAKKDFIAPTTKIEVDQFKGTELTLHLGESSQSFDTTDLFRKQVQTHYQIPAEYADRIRTAQPHLYAHTVNHFLKNSPARRMVRTLDGRARAFLSDSFRPLDNLDLAEAVVPELVNLPGLRVESTQFTEDRFYIKAVTERLTVDIKRGDAVQMGVVISNSEVGKGSLSISPMIFRLVCLNGMISADGGLRKTHVGRKADDMETAYEMFSQKTRTLDDAAFFSKVRDVVKNVLTIEMLEKLASKMRETTEQPIISTNMSEVVEVLATRFGYNDTTRQGVLKHLYQGNDFTRYGLLNAVTRQSQDEESYELATQLEADGNRIIELGKSEWRQIAEAA